MGFIDIAKQRYSCRKFQKKEVEEEKIVEILSAARIAPSAKNLQSSHFVIIKEDDTLEKIKSCYAREWIKSAPLIIVACGDHKNCWYRSDGKDYADIDVAIAVDHLTLAAADIGLGTCWVSNFDVMRCADVLQLPDGIEPIVMIPVGYPVDKADMDRHNLHRKSIQEIVHKEKFFYKYFKK